jgi:hypothetical protein
MVVGVPLTRVAAATAALVALVALVPAGARAAGDCPEQPAAQIFSPWGDPAWYVPAPGGSFEDGAPGWTLSDGAAIQAGNEDTVAANAGDERSLALPAGSEAVTAPICIDIAHPTIRLFVRNTGSPESTLRVAVRYRGLLGIPLTLPVGDVTGGSEWGPSDTVPVVVNLLTLVGGNGATFELAPNDDAGDWSIDDVYVDPYSKG